MIGALECCSILSSLTCGCIGGWYLRDSCEKDTYESRKESLNRRERIVSDYEEVIKEKDKRIMELGSTIPLLLKHVPCGVAYEIMRKKVSNQPMIYLEAFLSTVMKSEENKED